MAYGPLALKPGEFEALQIHEFNKMVEGYMLRKKEQERKQSYFTACIMSCMTSQVVQPDSIYYGLHPEDKPDPRLEREEFLKAVGLPSMMPNDDAERGGVDVGHLSGPYDQNWGGQYGSVPGAE